MLRSLLGAIILGAVAAVAGSNLGSTAAVNEKMLVLFGGLLGAITGAIIGGSADIVAAIKHNRPRPGNAGGGKSA